MTNYVNALVECNNRSYAFIGRDEMFKNWICQLLDDKWSAYERFEVREYSRIPDPS